jgi:c-di-GMP-binding flagellar brake protein YcgR
MAFQDTLPAPIDEGAGASPWAKFRVVDPRKVLAALRGLCTGDVPVTISSAEFPSTRATLWSVDDLGQRLYFNVEASSADVRELIGHSPLRATAYLQDIKVQFELHGVSFDDNRMRRTLSAASPDTLYLLPRRQALRVRPQADQNSFVRFRHPDAPATVSVLRVIDISTGGCGLWKPADGPEIVSGQMLHKVEVELDDENLFFTDMQVQHVTLSGPAAVGARVGCSWMNLPNSAQATLERWIRTGRLRRQLIALSFD